jgi:(4S)-4-hydroxy-5-phosphonooxypentane-2,3-dione isomerase
MIAVIVEFRILADKIDAFHQAIVDNARLSVQTESGCHQFDVCRDPADPALFFLYELYDDEAAFAVHLKTAHFLSMNAQTASWVEHKSVRTLQVVAAPSPA